MDSSTFFEYPTAPVQQAVTDGRDVRAHIDALRAGDWDVLAVESAAV